MVESPTTRDIVRVFVGRQTEMGELTAALDDALSGQGRMIMLAGEPGIGKTRTAQKVANYAEEFSSRRPTKVHCPFTVKIGADYQWASRLTPGRSVLSGPGRHSIGGELLPPPQSFPEVLKWTRRRLSDSSPKVALLSWLL